MENNEKLVKSARNFLLDLLPSAGPIVRRYLHAEELPSKKKGVHDFVTAADLAVDKFLQEHLNYNFSKIPILSEETFEDNLEDYKNMNLLFIIDPLDGTSNFARGDDNFCISVALAERGEPLPDNFQPAFLDYLPGSKSILERPEYKSFRYIRTK